MSGTAGHTDIAVRRFEGWPEYLENEEALAPQQCSYQPHIHMIMLSVETAQNVMDTVRVAV